MFIYRIVALSLILFPLSACNSLHSKKTNPQFMTTIEVIQKVDWQTKVEAGIKRREFIPLVAEVNRIEAQTILAQVNSKLMFTFTPNKFWLLSRVFNSTTFWLLSGVIFGLIELFLPETLAKKYRLFSLILGITSLVVAFISWRTSRLLEFQLQLIYWTGLSVACVLWVRPMLLKRKKFAIQDSAEALTLTEILPGQTGRVLYEGISWEALCVSQSGVIAPQTKVYVLRQEGNTLFVAPENLFHAE